MQPSRPFVSIIIPCRQEVHWIRSCLESILANDYPHDRMEVLVVDGMSDDGTRAVIEEFAAANPIVRMLDNPKRITPAALNAGVAAARGEIIIRIDAHTEYPTNYISSLVAWLERSEADNVGGLLITLPANETATAKAIALGCTHPFGVGNAFFRTGVTEPREVDTVPFGCYRRDVFDRIGLFDEELVRNQDIEFNLRLCRAGGRILLVPDVVSRYRIRSSLRKLFQTHYQNGYFNVLVARKTRGRITFRHLVPPLFVLALLTTLALSFWFRPMKLLFLLILIAYLIPLLAFSAIAAFRHGVRIGIMLALVFLTLHFSTGLGTLKGVLDFFLFRKRVTTAHTHNIPITR